MEKIKEKTNKEVHTEILPNSEFYLAENYHQKYYLQMVRELKSEFSNMGYDYNDFINSTAAARINGYIKGYGTKKLLMDDIESLGLSDKGRKRLVEIVNGYGR